MISIVVVPANLQAAKMRGVSFDLFHNTGCIFTLCAQDSSARTSKHKQLYTELDIPSVLGLLNDNTDHLIMTSYYDYIYTYMSYIDISITYILYLQVYGSSLYTSIISGTTRPCVLRRRPWNPGSWTWCTTFSPWWQWRNHLRPAPGSPQITRTAKCTKWLPVYLRYLEVIDQLYMILYIVVI